MNPMFSRANQTKIFSGYSNSCNASMGNAQRNSRWQTIVFTVLYFNQMEHVVTICSGAGICFQNKSVFKQALIGGLLLAVVLQLMIIQCLSINVIWFTKQAVGVVQISMIYNGCGMFLTAYCLLFLIVSIDRHYLYTLLHRCF